MERPAALLASLLSTHLVLEATGGRFVSPLERDGEIGALVEGARNVNTWPVLASPADDALLAAPILLPDHPSIAPESLGNLFDNTEIEEALLLHVQTLSDEEREEIEAQDPAVREMIERAARGDAREQIAQPPRPPGRGRPRRSPAARRRRSGAASRSRAIPNPGEQTLEIDGRKFRKGGKVVLRPGTGRDVYDGMLDGQAGDDRAPLPRLRGRRPHRGDDRRRPGAGAVPRDRALPVLQGGRGGGGGRDERGTAGTADPRRRDRQRLDARRRLRRPRRQGARASGELPDGRHRARLRHRRARPRLRGDARLRRPRTRRRQPPGRRARDAVRDRARARRRSSRSRTARS